MGSPSVALLPPSLLEGIFRNDKTLEGLVVVVPSFLLLKPSTQLWFSLSEEIDEGRGGISGSCCSPRLFEKSIVITLSCVYPAIYIYVGGD